MTVMAFITMETLSLIHIYLEERQRQLQELSAKLSKSERELRAAKKQAALAATSENGEEEVVEDEVVDTVIEGDEPVSEMCIRDRYKSTGKALEKAGKAVHVPISLQILGRQLSAVV